jgi:hypothetical protein
MLDQEQKVDLTKIKDGTVLLEPREDFDPCIVGYLEEEGRLIYSYEKMVEMFMKKEGWTSEEAVDWVSYNTVRACNYIENAPRIYFEDYEQETPEDWTKMDWTKV